MPLVRGILGPQRGQAGANLDGQRGLLRLRTNYRLTWWVGGVGFLVQEGGGRLDVPLEGRAGEEWSHWGVA